MNFINLLQVFIFLFSPSFFAEEVNYVDGEFIEVKGDVVFETEDLIVSLLSFFPVTLTPNFFI